VNLSLVRFAGGSGSLVRFAGGSGSLGRWGTMWLTGASSAVIKTTHYEDIEVPGEVAEDRPGGIVLLNEAMGRLLFLPYEGGIIAGFDLASGEELFRPVTLPRDENRGLRIPDYRILDGGGLIYLTECSLMRFGEDLLLIWRVGEDFGRWEIDGVSYREIVLVSVDERGRWEHQTWSLDDGRMIE